MKKKKKTSEKESKEGISWKIREIGEKENKVMYGKKIDVTKDIMKEKENEKWKSKRER